MQSEKRLIIFDVNSVQRYHADDVFHKAVLLPSSENIQNCTFVHCNRNGIKNFTDKSGTCLRQIKVKKML